MKLHDELPEFDENEDNVWNLPRPFPDISEALSASSEFTLNDIEKIESFSIFYHGVRWIPGNPTGSELELVMLGTLKDGRYFVLEGWNDYTGWGCQDGARLDVFDSRESAVHNGLTNSARELLAVG